MRLGCFRAEENGEWWGLRFQNQDHPHISKAPVQLRQEGPPTPPSPQKTKMNSGIVS